MEYIRFLIVDKDSFWVLMVIFFRVRLICSRNEIVCIEFLELVSDGVLKFLLESRVESFVLGFEYGEGVGSIVGRVIGNIDFWVDGGELFVDICFFLSFENSC